MNSAGSKSPEPPTSNSITPRSIGRLGTGKARSATSPGPAQLVWSGSEKTCSPNHLIFGTAPSRLTHTHYRVWNKILRRDTLPCESGGDWAQPGGHKTGKARPQQTPQPVVPAMALLSDYARLDACSSNRQSRPGAAVTSRGLSNW